MPKPTGQKKLLLRIGMRPFLEAQDGLCPLCGIGEWDRRPAPTAVRSFEKDYPALPYYAKTWDHVIPESKGGKFFGNCLVAHYGCNSRKAKAVPLPHEVAILKVVNERLGWDGVTYANTPVGQNLYAHLDKVVEHAGWERMASLSEPRAVLNWMMRKQGLEPSVPEPVVEPLPPPSERRYPPRQRKPSKGVLVAQRARFDHLIIRPPAAA